MIEQVIAENKLLREKIEAMKSAKAGEWLELLLAAYKKEHNKYYEPYLGDGDAGFVSFLSKMSAIAGIEAAYWRNVKKSPELIYHAEEICSNCGATPRYKQ